MYPINLKMMAKQLLWTHLNVEIIKGGIKYNVEYFFSQIVAVWPNGLRVFKPNTRLPSRGKLVLHFILQAWRNLGYNRQKIRFLTDLKMYAKLSDIEEYLDFKLEHKLGVFEVGRSHAFRLSLRSSVRLVSLNCFYACKTSLPDLFWTLGRLFS